MKKVIPWAVLAILAIVLFLGIPIYFYEMKGIEVVPKESWISFTDSVQADSNREPLMGRGAYILSAAFVGILFFGVWREIGPIGSVKEG